MVEQTLQEMPSSYMTVPELKRALPRKVHHTALLDILAYLQEKKQIYWNVKGITWLEEAGPLLQKMIKNGTHH